MAVGLNSNLRPRLTVGMTPCFANHLTNHAEHLRRFARSFVVNSRGSMLLDIYFLTFPLCPQHNRSSRPVAK